MPASIHWMYDTYALGMHTDIPSPLQRPQRLQPEALGARSRSGEPPRGLNHFVGGPGLNCYDIFTCRLFQLACTDRVHGGAKIVGIEADLCS